MRVVVMMVTEVCETEFDSPDKASPGYSACEFDVYGHVSGKWHGKVRRHRLTIRKNLAAGKFELIHHYYDVDTDEVIFASPSFKEAIEKANDEYETYWDNPDRLSICKHEEPNKAIGCNVNPSR
jgi:hypothetical protein